MRKHAHHRGARTLAAATVSALLATVAPIAFGPVATAPAAASPAPSGPLNETDALARAAATGQPTVADAMTTPTDTTVANPDGTLTLSRSMAPTRKRVGGQWLDLDATLHLNGDGSVSPNVALGQVVFSGGGIGPAITATVEGRTLALTAPVPLPSPTVAADTATYAQIHPGIDLMLKATAQGGFSTVLVARTAAAAADPLLANFAFTTTSDGITLSTDPAGNLRGTAGGRPVWSATAARMWDSTTLGVAQADALATRLSASSPSGPGAGARTAPVAIATTPGQLTLKPDPAMLAAAAELTYPLYIDPAFVPSSTGPVMNGWATVAKDFPSSNYWKNTPDPNGNMQVGNSGSIWSHTLINFPIPVSTLTGATILSATFKITEVYSYSCTAKQVNVYAPTTSLTQSNATWNYWDAVSLGSAVASATVAYGYNSSCPAFAVPFDVKSKIVSDVAANKTLQTFVMTAVNESSDLYGYKEFLASSPTLQITYNHPPSKPAGLTTSPASSCTGTATTIGQGSVTLYAPVSDPNGGALDVDFTLTKSGGSDLTGSGVITVSSGTTAALVVSQTTMDGAAGATPTTFTWQARATDGSVYGAWSDPCTFVYDTTRPGAPTVDQPITTPVIGTAVTLAVTKPANGTVPDRYLVQVNTDPPTMIKAEADGNKQIDIVPTRRVNTVSVAAVSLAGNISNTSGTVTFDADPAALAADKDFTGDNMADFTTIGSTNSLPPGLWLADGSYGGTLSRGATDIGVKGLGNGTAGTPSQFDGHMLATGHFAGDGFQDVLVYNRTTKNGAIIYGSGDGSILQPHSGQQKYIPTQALADRDYNSDNYDPTTEPVQIVNAYNIENNPDSYPDLLSVNGSTGDYHLDYYRSAGPGLFDWPVVLSATAPGGGMDWNNFTLATTEVNGSVWMFLFKSSTGSLYLAKDVAYNDASGLTYTLYTLKSSGWNTGAALTLQAADLDDDQVPDLRTLTTAGAVTAHLVSGLTTTPTLTSLSAMALATGTHSWSMVDGGTAGSTVTTTRDDNATLTATASGGATWATGDVFSPAIAANGTNATLTTSTAAVATNAAITLSVWAKPTAAGGVVLSQDGATVAGFKLWVDSTDKSWRFAMPRSDSTSAVLDTAAAPAGSAQLGAWTHITVTYQQATGNIVLYIDDVATAYAVHTTTWNATGGLRMAAVKTNTGPVVGSYYTGLIGPVEVWNQVFAPPGAAEHDMDANGRGDVIGLDTAGDLWFYPNVGTGMATFGTRVKIGAGGTGYRLVVTDWNRDGLADMVGADPAGALWLYINTGTTGTPAFPARTQIGTGWSGYNFTAGNADTNPAPDLFGIQNSTGKLYFYPQGCCKTEIGAGGANFRIYVSDFNHDTRGDLISIDTVGAMWFYPNTGNPGTGMYPTRQQIGSGWSPYKVTNLDLDGDKLPDIVAEYTDGKVWLYANNANNGFQTRTQIADWATHNLTAIA